MRKRHNGFTSFMKKLDGETNDDYFSETAGFGIRVHQGYECLLELLRGDICWHTYFSRFNSLRFAERQDMYNLRKSILGLDFPDYKVGVYVTDRSYYRKAIEYLREHYESQRQAELQRASNTRMSLSDTSNVYLSQLEDAYSRLSGPSS